MANITKPINRGIPPGMRTLTFNTATDANDNGTSIIANDIFKIEDSLGYPARHINIQVANSGTAVGIRFNPTVTVYPGRPSNEFGNPYSSTYPMLASGNSFLDTSQNPIPIGTGTSYNIDREVLVKEVQITTLGTSFTIIAS